MMGLFYDYHPQSCELLPCLTFTTGEREDCGEPGGLLVAVGFLWWSLGVAFGGECDHE